MTTFIPFTPSSTSVPPFSVPVTLDGTSYTLNVGWNVYGQRYYASLIDQSGNTTWNGGLVGSPLGGNIYLAPNIFTVSTILYREDTGNIEINP